MAVEGREGNIKCPVLLTTGEYDARNPVELVYKFYDNIKGPKELWVYEDAYHWTNLFPGTNENADSHNMGRDWIREALAGKFKPGYTRKTFLRTGGGGPHGTQGLDQDARHWWE